MPGPLVAAAVPAAIGALGSIGSSLLGRSNSSNEQMARHNIDYQDKLAKMGIRWRVADAKGAGIHPLAALGIGGASYSPVYLDGGDNRASDFLKQLGKGAQSVMEAKLNSEKEAVYDKRTGEIHELDVKLRKKQVEQLDLENKARARELLNHDTQGIRTIKPDTSYSPGVGSSTHKVQSEPDRVIAKGQPGFTAGVHQKSSWVTDEDGYVWKALSEKMSDSMDADMTNVVRDLLINGGRYVKGLFKKSYKTKKPNYNVPKGKILVFDRVRGQWKEVRKGFSKGVPRKPQDKGTQRKRFKIMKEGDKY